MPHAPARKADVITAADLPAMRIELCRQANDEVFSEKFRDVCRGAIAAIDQANDNDESTHALLAAGLTAYVSAGTAEMQRCENLRRTLDRLAEAHDAVVVRAALADLLPMLSKSNLTDVATLVLTTFAGIRPMRQDSMKCHTHGAGSFRRALPRRQPC